VVVAPLSTPDADLYTNVYEVPKSFGQALTNRSAGAADPFADPVAAGGGGLKGGSPNARDFLESQGITFPPGANVTYNPETSRLVVRNSADQMELVDALVDSVAPSPAAASPLPSEAAAAPVKMLETVTATTMSGTVTTDEGASSSTRGTVGIEGGVDSLERKTAVSSGSGAGEKAPDLFATAHVAEKAKQDAAAPAAQAADPRRKSDFVGVGTGGVLALNGGTQLKEEQAVGEALKAIIALTPQQEHIETKSNDRTKDQVIRRELSLETEPLAKGLEARYGIVKFGAGDLEITSGGNLFAISKANSPTLALDELSPATEPFSTFSLHVSDVSFQLAQAALAAGQWPEAEKIRIEEFVNAFDYGDPTPAMEERVACRIDQAAHPFLQQRNLVRIALRTSAAGRTAATPLRLTILLDSSGSMERPDRRETVRRAFATLAGLLGENDRITLITFARQPRLVADAVPGSEATRLAETVAALPSEGGTNLEAALQLGLEKAREHFDPVAQNRIVLMTDGATNLGDADAESLASRVVAMRQSGLAFDAAGFGADGVNDEVLEALTRNGDGRYYLLNRPEDAEAGFAQQIAGALRPSAKNVKVQVEFDPTRVKSYRLLGFEKHRLNTEDFRNDAVDAAELAASEAGVAVYQVEPDPAGTGDLGSVSVRFRDLESDTMIERRWVLPYHASAPRPEQGATSTVLATVASQFAAKLAGGSLGDVVDLGELAKLAAELPDGNRIQSLRTMIEQARELEGSP
jgi:Mg-chelatase subunit ChlD